MKKNKLLKRYFFIPYPLSLLLILPLLFSCSMNRLAVSKTSELINNGMPAIFSESDLDYAREAIPPNLKFMEILMGTERNGSLLFNASMGFCGYAFAFLEDSSEARATAFYLKGLAYSNELLEKHGLMEKGIMKPEMITRDNAPWLFWNTFCKSGLININRDDPDILSMMGEVREQASKIGEVYPGYFYNSSYNILGSLEATMPKVLGGNPEKAAVYFEKSLSGEGGTFLFNRLMYAKTYAVMTQDEALFDRLIEEITGSEIKKDDKALFNGVAAEKAKKLKEKKDELF